MRRTHRTVWLCGALLALAGGAVEGLWWTFSIGVGALVAALNLLVLSRTVQQLVDGRRASWGAVALVKFFGLAGLLYFLIDGGWVSTAGLAIGLGALPLGIVVSGFLFPSASADSPSAAPAEPFPRR